MKKLLIIIAVGMCMSGCDYSNSNNFHYCSERFMDNVHKSQAFLEAGKRDSALYYLGKADAYNEMEERFVPLK